MINAQEKRIDEKDAKLMFLEQKLANFQQELPVDIKSPKNKEYRTDIYCSKCNDRVFKTEKGLLRHIIDKHTLMHT